MSTKITLALCAIGLVWFGSGSGVVAQVKTFPLPDNTRATSIEVSFPANVAQMDGAKISFPSALSVPIPSIYFKESGRRVYLTADTSFAKDSAGAPILNQIALSNFRTLDDSHGVDLVKGSDDGGVTVPPVAAGTKRSYFITWESIRLETQTQAAPLITSARVGSSADNPPALSARLRGNKREFSVGTVGISARTLLNKFKSSPGSVRVVYEFDSDDPVPGTVNNEISSQAASLHALNAAGAPDDVNPITLIVDVGSQLPNRPENYTVNLKFPSSALRGFEDPGFKIPDDDEFVTASTDIDVVVAGLSPPSTDRAKTEFFFDSTFSSVVNAKSRKRSNVGLFGLHLKPTLPILTHNVYDRTQSPWWTALRPLLDADVDTQHIADSEAPNRVVFGADFELGRDAGLKGANSFLQQIVWINGIRYDSDRDFKLQTLYWHTELIPHFRNWEQTREQRLRQFRFPGGNPEVERRAKFPPISAYSFQPSIGYQLGGTVNRDSRVTGFPTNNVSRLFIRSSNAVEFRRLIKLSLDDTYYFLENAPRRRNRNYLEARLDINTGALFSVDLGSLQSAVTLKFQRGELPPRFKPVNAFSIGFRLYR